LIWQALIDFFRPRGPCPPSGLRQELIHFEVSKFVSGLERSDRNLGRLDYLARFQAAGADADALVGPIDACAHRPQVHVPAAAAHIVGVTDLISKLRAFAADIANLCHFH